MICTVTGIGYTKRSSSSMYICADILLIYSVLRRPGLSYFYFSKRARVGIFRCIPFCRDRNLANAEIKNIDLVDVGNRYSRNETHGL